MNGRSYEIEFFSSLLDYEAVRNVKPDIIYVSISRFGQFGPDHERAGEEILRALGFSPAAIEELREKGVIAQGTKKR